MPIYPLHPGSHNPWISPLCPVVLYCDDLELKLAVNHLIWVVETAGKRKASLMRGGSYTSWEDKHKIENIAKNCAALESGSNRLSSKEHDLIVPESLGSWLGFKYQG